MATPNDMIAAHLTWLRAGGYADNTVDDARKLLARVQRDLPFGITATTDELSEWLANPAFSAQTRATYFKHMNRLYVWASNARDPWLSENPMAGLRCPPQPKGLPRPASNEIVARCLDVPELLWRLACRLAALAGLRACEIATLSRDLVTEQQITVYFGKGLRSRVVPTHPLVWDIVAPMPSGPLVLRSDGRPANGDWVSMKAPLYLRSIGIMTTLYALRHWFGTNVQREYRDLRVTQELMGHASVSTTQVYTQVADEQRQAAVASLPIPGRAAASATA